MFSDSKTEHIQNIERKAKLCAKSWTIIYALLFPIFSYFALLSAMVFDNPQLSIPVGLSIIFLFSLIPLSLPLSIELMWSSFMCEEYSRTLIFWSLPWVTIIFVMILESIISFLFI